MFRRPARLAGLTLAALVAGAFGTGSLHPSLPLATPTRAPAAVLETQVSGSPDGRRPPLDRAFEPIVATHPTDPDTIAVAYQRHGDGMIAPAIRISHDGGHTWLDATGRPWAGSGRSPGLHSTIAWGPGPVPGSARLYWADTTIGGAAAGHLVSVGWSDDEGRTWSRLHVERRTPPWIGGFPDIAVDRNPASPNFGVVYVAYNWLADARTGPGLRLLASADFGRTWRTLEIPAVVAPAGYPAAWRIDYRVRAAPDGSVYVAFYQANLRAWDSSRIFWKDGV